MDTGSGIIDLLWKADVRMSQGPHSSGQHTSLPGRKYVWKLQTDDKRKEYFNILLYCLSEMKLQTTLMTVC